MNQWSPYFSGVFRKNRFSGEAGFRLNLHSEYGNNFTYTLNPALLLDKVKLFVNFYSAFKAPTLYQLFDPSAGNSRLQPEQGMIEEAGLHYSDKKNLTARLVGFYRRTKDAILYTYNPLTYESKYVNAAVQKNYGFESEIHFEKGIMDVSVNYTYTDGKTLTAFDGTGVDLGKDTTYYNLYRIPKHALNLIAGFKVSSRFYTSVSIRSLSKRDEFIYGGMPEKLAAYTTIDLYAEYHATKKCRLFIDLRNLTDKKYFEVMGYNAKRFNVTGGVSLKL
jgi:vitamin B12 transporter